MKGKNKTFIGVGRMVTIVEARELLEGLSESELVEVLKYLRHEKGLSLHRLEKEFHVQAEVILESIARGNELTRRMLRGVIAEAIFKMEVIDKLVGWIEILPEENSSADFIIDDGGGALRIQAKLQRKEKGRALKKGEYWFVETQKTRNGKDKSGDKTRFYREGEFDILAVCMEPSTGRWEDFRYTVERNLKREGGRLSVMQKIPIELSDGWTNDLDDCIKTFRKLK